MSRDDLDGCRPRPLLPRTEAAVAAFSERCRALGEAVQAVAGEVGRISDAAQAVARARQLTATLEAIREQAADATAAGCRAPGGCREPACRDRLSTIRDLAGHVLETPPDGVREREPADPVGPC